jgi:hypothetical protein
MKKSFLIKTAIVLCLFVCFFLIWQVNTAKAFCEIQKKCASVQEHLTPAQINSFGVFPFYDLLIKM